MIQPSREQLKKQEMSEGMKLKPVEKILTVIDALRGYKEGTPVWEKHQKRIAEEYKALTPEQKLLLKNRLQVKKDALEAKKNPKETPLEEPQPEEEVEEEVIAPEDTYTHLLDNPRDIRKVQEQLFIKKTGERLKKERSTINRVSGVIEDTFIKNPRFENLARAWQNTMRGNGGDVGVLALLEQIEKIEKNPRNSLQGSIEKIADEVRSMLDGLKRRFETALKNKEINQEEYHAIINFIERIYPQESPLEENTEEAVLEAAA